MERYELAEWNPENYYEYYKAQQAFNARVRPRNPEKGKWYGVYAEGPKKGQKMLKFDAKAGHVMYCHKTSKLAKKLELNEATRLVKEMAESIVKLPNNFKEAEVEWFTAELEKTIRECFDQASAQLLVAHDKLAAGLAAGEPKKKGVKKAKKMPAPKASKK